MSSDKNKNSRLVTTITGIEERALYLYDDGKVYRRDTEDKLIELKNENSKDKKSLEKVFDRFKNLKTDVKK